MEFIKVKNDNDIKVMSDLATKIVREHYDPILGKAQNDYMLEKFQSPRAIKEQINGGYSYYFVRENGADIGFTAFYPRNNAMYISKLYLLKEERGKGYSHKMLDFVADKARGLGLSAIELNVNRFNSSVDIYKKLGFEIIRQEKIDIGSGYYMDDYVCRLDLK
ncbi:MAG: GNAT family N-acetyltransferase [Ruminococcus sp.]|nr:GNAT family N-acetyltransferase [Ruminococcus sp.]